MLLLPATPGALGGDQSVRGLDDRPRRERVGDRRRVRVAPVHQRDQLRGQRLRIRRPDAPGQVQQPRSDLALVSFDDRSGRVAGVGVLGGTCSGRDSRDNRAVGPSRSWRQPALATERSADPLRRRRSIPPLEESSVPLGQVGDDQIVLRREVPVQAHLRHAGSLDDRVDADGAHTLRIKELRRGVEYLLARLAARLLFAATWQVPRLT